MDFTISFLQLFFQILQVVVPTVLLLVSLIVLLGQIAVQATTWAVGLHADLGELKGITNPDN